MAKKLTNVLKQILRWKEILFTISTIVVAVVNIWFSFRLLPITQRIDNIESKVLANETNIGGISQDIQSLETKIESVFDKLDKKIDNIYTILINR